jgi:N-acetylglutamate synthase-like GNAT family acetyltransferase
VNQERNTESSVAVSLAGAAVRSRVPSVAGARQRHPTYGMISLVAPTIRNATINDADSVRQLVSEAYSVYIERIGRRPAPMDAAYESLIAQGHVWVVGVVVLEAYEDHLLVENLAVHPSWQGRGVGGQLLALAEAQALATSKPEMRLYTNERMVENLRYYTRRGFIETHRARSEGFDRVHFVKPL